jgi:hypothetical protein
MITDYIASDDSDAGSCIYSNVFTSELYPTYIQIKDVNSEMLTMVVENLPYMQGAIGVGSANLIIYRGNYTFPIPTDKIVAYTDRPLIGNTNAAYRLCVFEHSNFG